jgi:hypothetical protein
MWRVGERPDDLEHVPFAIGAADALNVKVDFQWPGRESVRSAGLAVAIGQPGDSLDCEWSLSCHAR